jgi:FHA domain/DUF1707 SHOCT-like domain
MEPNPDGVAPAGRPGPPWPRWRGPGRIRACEADRDKVISQLWMRYDEGRLSYPTFALRVEAAVAARTRGELAGLLADLPAAGRLRAAMAACWERGATGVAAALPWLRRGAPPVLRFPSGPQHRFTIGRDAGCDMVLPDPTVSRWHAGLRRCGGGWLLDDLGSTNGTTLNGWRVRAWVPVHDGDLVCFGGATFVFGGAPGDHRVSAAGGASSG